MNMFTVFFIALDALLDAQDPGAARYPSIRDPNGYARVVLFMHLVHQRKVTVTA